MKNEQKKECLSTASTSDNQNIYTKFNYEQLNEQVDDIKVKINENGTDESKTNFQSAYLGNMQNINGQHLCAELVKDEISINETILKEKDANIDNTFNGKLEVISTVTTTYSTNIENENKNQNNNNDNNNDNNNNNISINGSNQLYISTQTVLKKNDFINVVEEGQKNTEEEIQQLKENIEERIFSETIQPLPQMIEEKKQETENNEKKIKQTNLRWEIQNSIQTTIQTSYVENVEQMKTVDKNISIISSNSMQEQCFLQNNICEETEKRLINPDNKSGNNHVVSSKAELETEKEREKEKENRYIYVYIYRDKEKNIYIYIYKYI